MRGVAERYDTPFFSALVTTVKSQQGFHATYISW
jgi:hypothetical protein